MANTDDVEKIGLDVPVQDVYPSFVDRYFTPRYVLDIHSKCNDMCIQFHSNRACLITLAPSHPVLVKGKKIVKVDFEAEESEEDIAHMRPKKRRNQSTNRLDNKVSGKKKKGAQILHRMSLLCKIELEDGSVHAIRSGIPGLLVEVNEQLIENPNLLREKPSSNGYIAIMLPKTLESDRLRDKLMTPEQYQKAIEERKNEEISGKSVKLEQDEGESTAPSNEMEPNGTASTGASTVKQEIQDSTDGPDKVEQNGNASTVAVTVKQDQDCTAMEVDKD